MQRQRGGFSLLELVLSIIVVAIVSVSVPTIISQTSQANAKSLLQESVMNAKTYMTLVLKSPFTCAHISTNPNSPLPIFYGERVDGVYNNFYQEWNLNGDGRRFFLPKISRTTAPVSQNNVNLNLACGSGAQKSINDFSGNRVDGINNTFTVDPNPKSGRISRDFIVGSTYTTDITNSDNSFGNRLDSDVKRVRVTVALTNAPRNSPANIALDGFATNIGDGGGALMTRVW